MKNNANKENIFIQKQIEKQQKENIELRQEIRQILVMAKQVKDTKQKKQQTKKQNSQQQLIEKSNQKVNMARDQISEMQQKINILKNNLYENDNFVITKELQDKIKNEEILIEKLRKKNEKLLLLLSPNEKETEIKNLQQEGNDEIEQKKQQIQDVQQIIQQIEEENAHLFQNIVKNQKNIKDMKNDLIISKSSNFLKQFEQISKESIEKVLSDFKTIKEQEQKIREQHKSLSEEQSTNMQKLESQEKILQQEITHLKKKKLKTENKS